MLKVSEKNTFHFTRNLKKHQQPMLLQLFSFLCWLFCCDDIGEYSTVCILQYCICKSVLPCVCSINRTFTPHKAYVPDQSTVFVCTVSVPIKKCSSCSFFCRNTIIPTTIIWHRSRIYDDMLTFSHFSCPVQISGQFVSRDSFSSSWNSHKRHH